MIGCFSASQAIAGPSDLLPADASTGASPGDSVEVVDGVQIDAQWYAGNHGVSGTEAVERVQVQIEIDQLTPLWRELAGDRLAGLFFVHEPDLSVVIRLVGLEPLRALEVATSGFPVWLEYGAALSLAELNAIVEAFAAVAAGGPAQGLYADERTGEVVIHVFVGDGDVDDAIDQVSAAFQTAAAGDDVLFRMELIDGPGENTNRGGRITWACTSGFTVQNGAGTQGMTTAGHCGDYQPYRWFSDATTWFATGFQAEVRSSVADLQWHTTSAQPIEALFHADSTTTARAQIGQGVGAVGQSVCRRGRTTGYDCTHVTSINYAPLFDEACPGVTCSPVFSLTDGAATQPGDSGGPWFLGNTPHGITMGHVGSSSFYTRVWYLNQLGLTLLQGTEWDG
jgi:hypothetical protein